METTPFSFDYNTGHPSTQPIADDVEFLEVKTTENVVEGSNDPNLSHAEIQFFKTNGYLIKRGFLADCTKVFEQAIDHFWSGVPNRALTPEGVSGWLDAPGAHWRPEDHPKVGTLLGTNWKMRSPGESGVGTESFLVEGIANHPKMLALAGEFLKAPVRPVNRVRGIYGIFPLPVSEQGKLFPHGDYMASQLSAMVLLVDVPHRCGGFTIWPGSHKRMHLCWDKVSGSAISGDKVSRYTLERDNLLRDTHPMEFTGKAGDVIIWHPRLIHSAGVNYSAQDGRPMVRILTPIDYQRTGETHLDDLEFGPGPRYQWWVDTRNTIEDVGSTSSNLWHGWSLA